MSYLDELLNNGTLSLCYRCVKKYEEQGYEVQFMTGMFDTGIPCIACKAQDATAQCKVRKGDKHVVRQ